MNIHEGTINLVFLKLFKTHIHKFFACWVFCMRLCHLLIFSEKINIKKNLSGIL